MSLRRWVPAALLVALIVAVSRGASVLANYYDDDVVTLPSTGAGSSGTQLTDSLPMVGLTVLALVIVALVVGNVVRRTRAGETA